MKLVKATNQSQLRKLRIRELGRLASVGEQFIVDDDRYLVLAGDNKYKAVFVTLVKDLPEKLIVIPEMQSEEKVESPLEVKKVDIPADETPEVIIIEPNQEPIKVSESLTVEESSEVPVEKKKRTRKKKVVTEEK